MEERIKAKLEYLNSIGDKYENLNTKTKYKYNYRLNGIREHIYALENVLNNITGEWDECYKEDLKESEGN
ncbi:hypothetical protein [Clostridium butyricum]|uniref:hypothetical protein n=1 Tax=Clostridium butyricum TaxID=1492 RepID=UPI0013CFE770|nr:hypothetical protein [Clostridium butyricum]MCQ2017306.1 hypothetical protein [Clostridium butyricum]MCQ2023085.1 hypothetical protein [Clostridium butyricum]NFB73153.1 hypothetical protein [Clostridium butyricum]NFB92669.1 hypothetical protein [Clostridium butyricum]UTY53555.1 hypothetical protein HNS01_10795 [Clostridium butyricum]